MRTPSSVAIEAILKVSRKLVLVCGVGGGWGGRGCGPVTTHILLSADYKLRSINSNLIKDSSKVKKFSPKFTSQSLIK